MAILEKIRKRSWLILPIIGLGLLSFIFDPKFIYFFMEKKSDVIGEVNDSNIYANEYMDYINFQKHFKKTSENSFKNQVWDHLINEKLLLSEIDKVGIQFSKKDFWNFISKNSIYSKVPFFNDNNGMFSINKFKSYISNLENKPKNNLKYSDEYIIWNFQKKDISKQLLSDQYLEMSTNGLNTTLIEAKISYMFRNSFLNMDYIFLPYYEYENKFYKKIHISNKEIVNYVNKHKNNYITSPFRDINFVVIPIKPSYNDINKIKVKMNGLVGEFKKTKNDSLFISKHSEIQYTRKCYSENSLPFFLKGFLEKSKVGNIYGPIFQDENSCFIVKILGRNKIPGATKFSHILISYKGAINSHVDRTKKEAEIIAKRFYKRIKNNSIIFKNLVSKSDDIISIRNKGDLGWINNKSQGLTSNYQKYLNKGKKGEINIIETPFGFHIVRIDKKSPSKFCYNLAIILKTFFPSKKTENEIRKKAISFFNKNKNVNKRDFINHAIKKNYITFLSKNIKKFHLNIKELGSGNDLKIINWSFNKKRKLGDVHFFNVPNKYYVIPYISYMQKNIGLPEINRIKNDVIPILRRIKITNIIKNDIINNKKNTMEDISKYLSKDIKNINSINLDDPTLPELGLEPKIIGSAFGLPLNKISHPIMGNNGIFILKVNKKNNVLLKNKVDYIKEEQYNNIILNNSYINFIMRVLRKDSRVKDYRNSMIFIKK